MGYLGWSEYQYYTSSPEAFYYAAKGYFNKRKQEENWHRMVATIMHRSIVSKPTDINSVWPIFESDVIKSQPITEERISEIMKRYAPIIKKKTDA